MTVYPWPQPSGKSVALRSREGTQTVPTLIASATRVAAAGNKPKLIDEYFGRVNSADEHVSIAHMRSPAAGRSPDRNPSSMSLRLCYEARCAWSMPVVAWMWLPARASWRTVASGCATARHRPKAPNTSPSACRPFPWPASIGMPEASRTRRRGRDGARPEFVAHDPHRRAIDVRSHHPPRRDELERAFSAQARRPIHGEFHSAPHRQLPVVENRIPLLPKFSVLPMPLVFAVFDSITEYLTSSEGETGWFLSDRSCLRNSHLLHECLVPSCSHHPGLRGGPQ